MPLKVFIELSNVGVTSMVYKIVFACMMHVLELENSKIIILNLMIK